MSRIIVFYFRDQVRIHKFLEKSKKKSNRDTKNEDAEVDSAKEEQEALRKRVMYLLKKSKVHQVRKIVKGQDDSKSWGQEAQAKVFCL